jgi:hypothetical protein
MSKNKFYSTYYDLVPVVHGSMLLATSWWYFSLIFISYLVYRLKTENTFSFLMKHHPDVRNKIITIAISMFIFVISVRFGDYFIFGLFVYISFGFLMYATATLQGAASKALKQGEYWELDEQK